MTNIILIPQKNKSYFITTVVSKLFNLLKRIGCGLKHTWCNQPKIHYVRGLEQLDEAERLNY